jgi:CTP:molybdopterin cytidylyltransferase MocA
MVDAVVLSGGALERERFPGLDPGIARKAQIPILGRPMVGWTVAALRGSPEVGRIVVVGHSSLASPDLEALRAELVPEREDIAANLRAGLEMLPGSERVIALSGDLPLLTPGSLADLFAHAPRADVVFPYVERAEILRAYPERHWIYAQTPEGAFTGCSAALVRPAILLERWGWVQALLDARRKSPLAMAAMFGLGFGLKLLFRRLRVRDVEKKLSGLLHLDGRGYRTRCAELAMDVDKYSDIALVERLLQERGAAEGNP